MHSSTVMPLRRQANSFSTRTESGRNQELLEAVFFDFIVGVFADRGDDAIHVSIVVQLIFFVLVAVHGS